MPPAFYASNDRTLEIEGVHVEDLSIANLKVTDIGKFYRVLGDQATNSLVVDYLICRAEERHELDPKDTDLVNYYHQRTDFVVQTKPSAEQLTDWDKQHPAPRKIGKLVAPDFINEDGKWVLIINDPAARHEAKIDNFGEAAFTYVLGNIPEPDLWVMPRQQEQVSPKGESVIQIYLGYGATKPEYTFTLQSSVEPDREIIVRIPKLAALQAKQDHLTADLTSKLLASLPAPSATTAAVNNDAGVADRLVDTAAKVVQSSYPDLDEASRWVITSQVLLASHWPSLAATALNRAEQSDATVSQRPTLQQYAARVGYLANTPTVFVKNPLRVADILTPADSEKLASNTLQTNPLVRDANQANTMKLIAAMEPYQSLRGVKLSLQGDLYVAQQRWTEANSTYGALFNHKPSPSASIRLTAAQAESGNIEQAKRTAIKTFNSNDDAVSKKVMEYAIRDVQDRPTG